jgi:hypothetical protein
MEPAMYPTKRYTGAQAVRISPVFLLIAALFLCPATLFAASAEQAGVPRLLQEWIPWVLHNQEEKTCTIRSDDISKRYCTWPSRLTLDVAGNGATFQQEWLVETKSLVPLPGSRKLWPESVKDGTKNIIITDHSGIPSVWLDRGAHSLSGRFTWGQSPEYIDIPAAGLVSVKNNNSVVASPRLDKDGKLWLKAQKEEKTDEMDRVSIQVFRKIQDTIPLLEDLHILLTVSGSPREIPLGKIIKDDFLPLRITSPLPARLDQDGRLCIQTRPGQWQIDLVLRHTGPASPEKLGIGTIDGIWPDSEIWVFEAAANIREVTVENVQSIDPSRTVLPKNWLNLPAYLVNRQDTMILVEKARGNPRTIPDRLTLSRTLWLDERGTGLTAFDTINGTMTKGWRLNAVPEQHLGKVDVDGVSQLITRLPESDLVGVEVRKGNISLTADSRIEQPVRGMILTFPAPGWNHTFQQLSAHLNLPPGWKVLTSSGIDKISTWLNRWTLLDIFLILIITLAIGKILGWWWGALSLVTLGLIYHQPESPQHLWLPLLALLAVSHKVTSAKGKTLIRIPVVVIMVLLLLQSIPFMVREIRIGLFPQLEYGPYFQVTPDTRGGQNVQPTDLQKEDKAKSSRPAPAPPTAPAPAQAEKMYSLGSSAAMGPAESLGALSKRIDTEMQIDPQAMIQTGPGLPNWHWQVISLGWNGPVGPDQKVHLVLLSPVVNCILGFLRVGLLTLMLTGVFCRSLNVFPARKGPDRFTWASLVWLFPTILILSGSPPASAAEIPSSEMLQELQTRLLIPPDCRGECASLETCLFSMQGEKFSLLLTLHAVADTAVALPGDSQTFSQILVDNAPATGIRADAGSLLIRLSPGIHQVSLIKDVHDIDDFNLTFPLLPHRAVTKLTGWDITGIHPDGTIEKQITMIRLDTKKNSSHLLAGMQTTVSDFTVPPFFQVDRILHLGLKWTVETRIIRKSQGNIITAEIPLIPGEMPTSESLYITDKNVQVNLGPHDVSFSWQSVLPVGQSITLTAPKTQGWTESWHLDVSPIWHVTTTGIPEVSQMNPAGLRFPEYRPHPGESLTMAISRPEGVPGPTLTIDSSLLHVTPGVRATDFNLHFALHASRGTRHSISLPGGSELQKVMLNDKEHPVQLNGSQLTLPIQPGNQQINISWSNKNGIAARLHTPEVDLGLGNVNATIQVEIPSSRWILMTGGPKIGPAVLFWGEILVIFLLALILGRISLTPLTTLQWLLLGMGLSQVNVVFGAMVAGWLFLLGVRKNKGAAIVSTFTFNLFQIVLTIATIAACLALIYAVQQGLLGHPDMQIGGNGSTGHSLRWYQDRNDHILPQAWVVSVPLLFYRVLMLIWALWLALSLLKWLNWGWGCFCDGGTWRKTIRQPTTKDTAPGNEPESLQPVVENQSTEKQATAQGLELTGPQRKSWFRRFGKKSRP